MMILLYLANIPNWKDIIANISNWEFEILSVSDLICVDREKSIDIISTITPFYETITGFMAGVIIGQMH